MYNAPDWLLYQMGIELGQFVIECGVCGQPFYGDLLDQEYGGECSQECWFEGHIMSWDEAKCWVDIKKNARILDRLNVRMFGEDDI